MGQEEVRSPAEGRQRGAPKVPGSSSTGLPPSPFFPSPPSFHPGGARKEPERGWEGSRGERGNPSWSLKRNCSLVVSPDLGVLAMVGEVASGPLKGTRSGLREHTLRVTNAQNGRVI